MAAYMNGCKTWYFYGAKLQTIEEISKYDFEVTKTSRRKVVLIAAYRINGTNLMEGLIKFKWNQIEKSPRQLLGLKERAVYEFKPSYSFFRQARTRPDFILRGNPRELHK